MISSDGRQATNDTNNKWRLPGTLFSDPDGTWNTAGRISPGQPAGVDAHYYANVTDDYYMAIFNRNSLNNNGMRMVSTAHYGRNYNIAFWNGQQIAYGEGKKTFRELSGGLDVTTHEFTHGVTDFTSDLVYQGESGALNESFSHKAYPRLLELRHIEPVAGDGFGIGIVFGDRVLDEAQGLALFAEGVQGRLGYPAPPALILVADGPSAGVGDGQHARRSVLSYQGG